MCTYLRRHVTTTIGAIITVGAIALDPFSQAVIGFYDCSVQDMTLHSTIARVNTFGYYELGASSAIGMPVSLERAIVAGIAAPGDISVAHSCPSGNCSFSEPYSSVGYCSECDDVTKNIKENCPDPVNECNFTLPPDLTVGHYEDGNWDVHLAVNSPAYTLLTTESPTDSPYMSTLEFPIEILARTVGDGDNRSAVASTCRLRPCVKTYMATIDGSNITESLVSSTPFNQTYKNSEFAWWLESAEEDIDNSELITQIIRVGCLTEDEKTVLSNHDIDLETPKDWISWHKKSLNDTVPVAPKCVYQFQTVFHGILGTFLITYFNGSTGTDDASALQSLQQSQLDVLFNDRNISVDSIRATFDSIAEAITNTIRDPPASLPYLNETEAKDANYQYRDLAPAEGHAMKNTSCVVVNWPWMILPAALTVAAAIFLILLIINTVGETSSGVWKTSQVALLWHGLQGPARDEGINLTNVRDMNRRAKELQVQLRNTSSGWKLSQDTGLLN
ncbi:MAG: hypothetical protein MMC23_000085 [Stictis urceolatum]|nr:hypothetical protein [Stictis urceolata]